MLFKSNWSKQTFLEIVTNVRHQSLSASFHDPKSFCRSFPVMGVSESGQG